MRLRDYGETFSRDWLQQLLQWSQKKVTFEDNIDGVEILVYINTTLTEVNHGLGRIPKTIIPFARYPHGISDISFETKEPTNEKIFLKRAVAGHQWIRLE